MFLSIEASVFMSRYSRKGSDSLYDVSNALAGHVIYKDFFSHHNTQQCTCAATRPKIQEVIMTT